MVFISMVILGIWSILCFYCFVIYNVQVYYFVPNNFVQIFVNHAKAWAFKFYKIKNKVYLRSFSPHSTWKVHNTIYFDICNNFLHQPPSVHANFNNSFDIFANNLIHQTPSIHSNLHKLFCYFLITSHGK